MQGGIEPVGGLPPATVMGLEHALPGQPECAGTEPNEDQGRNYENTAALTAQIPSMNAVVSDNAVGSADPNPSKHMACVRDLEPSGSHGSAVNSSQVPNYDYDDSGRPAAALISSPCKMSTVDAPDVSECPTISQTVASRVNDLE